MRGYMHMRRRIHAYEEEDTCIWGGGCMHMRRRIHALRMCQWAFRVYNLCVRAVSAVFIPRGGGIHAYEEEDTFV
jgi:hypothetical protein